MALINSKNHGIIDYAVVLFLFASPTFFNLPHGTALFTYALACVHLLLTVCTNFELGIVKVIPFSIHGIIELIVAIALGGLAYYFRTQGDVLSSNFYFGFAIAVFVTWLLTGYKNAPAHN